MNARAVVVLPWASLAVPLDTPSLRAAGEALLAGLAGWITLEVAMVLVGYWAKRTATDLDDLFLAAIRRPLRVLVLGFTLLGVLSPLSTIPASSIAVHAIRIFMIIAVMVGFERLIIQVLLRAARRWSARTETYVDDMLVPIAETLVRPIAVCIGAVVALQSLGLPVQAIALIVGGGSFVLAFALQSSLEDIFGGISMLVDSPFTYGDVLKLVDGNVCEVLSLGLRVTHLYNAADHSVISMPNRELASQRVVNLSRPTPDMRHSIRVSVAENSDMALVSARLLCAANAHPWVLGETSAKLVAMRSRLHRLVWQGKHSSALTLVRSMEVIEAEGRLNDALDEMATHLVMFAGLAHRHEHHGVDVVSAERMQACVARLLDVNEEVRLRLGCWVMSVRRTYVTAHESGPDASALQERMSGFVQDGPPSQAQIDQFGQEVEQLFDPIFKRCRDYRQLVEANIFAAARIASAPDATFPVIGRVSEADAFFVLKDQEEMFRQSGFSSGLADHPRLGIGELHEAEEYIQIFVEWNRKMKWLETRIRSIVAEVRAGSGRRLDERLYELRRWLTTDFKESSPDWKYPLVTLLDVGEGLVYGLHFYVDNVRLSHFTRAMLTEHQLREEIVHLFRDLYPRIEFSDPEFRVTMNRSDPSKMWSSADAFPDRMLGPSTSF